MAWRPGSGRASRARRRRVLRAGAPRRAAAPAGASRGLVECGEQRLVLGRLRVVLGLHVRRHTRPALDATPAQVAPAREEVLADGDVERAAVGQRLDLLEHALAEPARAVYLRAVAILQRARHDLRPG